MREKSKILLILGISAVLFSIYAFVIPFERGIAFWICYIAEIIALSLQYPIFQSAFREKSTKTRFYGFPLVRLGYLYLGIQTVVSVSVIPLASFFKFPGWLSILLCVAVLSFAIIGIISSDLARNQVQAIDTKHNQNIERMTEFRSLVSVLPSLTEDSELKQILLKMSEDFQFSDPVSKSSTDDIEQELSQMLLSLKTHLTQNSATVDEISRIREKLSQRNEICKRLKY